MITKKCCKCKEVKAIKEFYKAKNRKDGHQTYCKTCNTKREYSKTEKFKLYAQKYRQSEVGKKKQLESIKRIQKKHPRFINALTAIAHAIKANKIPKASSLICHFCLKPAQHYHHPFGYDLEHQFNIIPVCAKCHKQQHKNTIP